jgi:hypothetical protein
MSLATASDVAHSDDGNPEQVAYATFLLRKLLVSHPDFTEDHTWAYEHDRWAELIYALFSRFVSEERAQVRTAVWKLSDLGLLEGPITDETERAQRERQFLVVLEEAGFTSDEALQAWTVFQEASNAIQEKFGGKIHLFLRDHAELMLRQLCENIPFSAFDAAQAEQGFALWLQNSCNLPLSVFDHHVIEFSERYDISLPALVTAADNLNLNLALVDDLIREDVESRRGGECDG